MQHENLRVGPPDTASLGRRPALDGLRAFAVALVVVFHVRSEWMHGGFFGVDVFFVLSGFLITRLLLEEIGRQGRVDLRDFFRRRAVRLFPALAVVLVAVAVYNVTWEPSASRAHTRSGLWSTPLYVSNFFDVHADSAIAHSWSLAVEEHFYLVWPAVLALLCWLGATRRAAITTALVGIGASATTFALLHTYTNRPVETLGFWTFDRPALVLLIGALSALVLPLDAPRLAGVIASVLAVPAAVVLALLSLHARPNDSLLAYGGYAGIGALVVVLLAAVLWRPQTWRVLAHPVLVWIGRRSYAIYLWHIPLRNVAWAHPGELGDPSKNVRDLGVIVASLVAAELSHRLVEAPVARWATRRKATRAAPERENDPGGSRDRPHTSPSRAPVSSG